ncbi:hypothetical protein [Nitrosococcus oceani]|uniref:hypothetical protein n=1 Tax=Nitrosococcus oceani TaxID=1229 RepID=UPI0009DF63B3|nr:hypothetical protein [Nitrosococcus oceani]
MGVAELETTEVGRLRQKLADTCQERETLKKAVAHFAKESLQGIRSYQGLPCNCPRNKAKAATELG